jgi:hypothetical protein
MYGTKPWYEAATLDSLLNVLDALSLSPTGWSFDERTNLPFAKDELLARAGTGVATTGASLFLRNKGVKKYEAWITLGKTPMLRVEFGRGLPKQYWKDVFDLADALVHTFAPDLGMAHVGPPYDYPWQTDLDRDAELIGGAADLAYKDHYKFGPLGLAARTYLGPHYAAQFGKESLLSTPAATVREDERGGITIDLTDNPWDVELEPLVSAWRAAMEHLRPAEVFATCEVKPTGLKVYKRGARCQIGGVVKAS